MQNDYDDTKNRKSHRESEQDRYDTAVRNLESEKIRKRNDLDSQKRKWDKEASTTKDTAISEVKRNKQSTDKKIESVKKLRNKLVGSLKAKK